MISDREILMLLNMASGIGPVRLEGLLKRFGSLSAILSAQKKDFEKIENIGPLIAGSLYDGLKNRGLLDKEASLVKKHKLSVVTILDNDYPRLLKGIHNPPLVLYVKGTLDDAGIPNIAVVGSRRASVYGLGFAESVSYRLACLGACVVSGLARGIDTAAHKGALKGHGRTIAVLGSGLGSVYPPENKRLVSDIVDKGGAVVSEFSVLERPNPRNFPRRNRIISGLSLGTVVVEAARNSGALITADFALNQGREVFAVPGKADSPTSFGTNRLIKQGARLIQNAEDILQELGLSLRQAPPEENIHQTLSDKEKTIYDKLTDEPRFLDEIARDSGVPVFAAMDSLTRLQLKKLVREFPGKRFTKETKCLRP